MNRYTRFAPQAAAGLSLIELIISIALVSIILAGVVKLYADSHRSFLSNEDVAQTQESIRYVLNHIDRNAAKAGYIGCAKIQPQEAQNPYIDNLIDTSTEKGRRYKFEAGAVSGTDGGADGSDTLILRSAMAAGGIRVAQHTPSIKVHNDDLTKFTNSGLKKGDVVVLSDCKKARIFMMTNSVNPTGVIEHAKSTIGGISNAQDTFKGMLSDPSDTLVSLFSVMGSSVTYRIGDSANASATDTCATAPEFCALFANEQELLQGVENFQVLYGVRLGDNIEYNTATNVSDWQNVTSVQVTVTFTNQTVSKTVNHVVALRNGDL